MKDMLTLFFMLQIVSVLSFYAFASPATLDIVNEQLGTLVNFKFLNINWVLGKISPGLSIQTLLMSQQDRFNEKSSEEGSSGMLMASAGMAILAFLGFSLFLAVISCT